MFHIYWQQKNVSLLPFSWMEPISQIDPHLGEKAMTAQSELSMTRKQLFLAENTAKWQANGSALYHHQAQYVQSHTLQSFTWQQIPATHPQTSWKSVLFSCKPTNLKRAPELPWRPVSQVINYRRHSGASRSHSIPAAIISPLFTFSGVPIISHRRRSGDSGRKWKRKEISHIVEPLNDTRHPRLWDNMLHNEPPRNISGILLVDCERKRAGGSGEED